VDHVIHGKWIVQRGVMSHVPPREQIHEHARSLQQQSSIGIAQQVVVDHQPSTISGKIAKQAHKEA
jgi:hypothetical protein